MLKWYIITTNKLKSTNLSKILKTLLLVVVCSNIALSQNSGFGSLTVDRNKPLEFNSDSLVYNQEKNFAELFNNVKIVQGNSVLSAEYVKTVYSKDDDKLEKIFAEKNVEFKSGEDIARGDYAVYSLIDNSISVTGNAELIQGSNNILADQIMINTETGITQLLGSVKTVISKDTN